jgi:hypothetical protein
MNTRFVVSICALVLLVGANAFLLGEEDFEVRSTEVIKVTDDPLGGMRFVGKREDNLKRIGLPRELREKTARAANRLDRQVGKRLVLAMQKSERNAQLAEDLCGRGMLPRRYMLLESLVQEGRDGRVVIPSNRINFEPQEWFLLSRVEELHEKFERVEGGSADASARILAAVLADKEAEAIDSQGVWSHNEWSWKRVLESEPALEGKLTDFLALGLVVLERAQIALCASE